MVYKSYYVSNQFEMVHSISSIILRQSMVWQSISLTFLFFCGSGTWILFACRIKCIITHTHFTYSAVNIDHLKKKWNYPLNSFKQKSWIHTITLYFILPEIRLHSVFNHQKICDNAGPPYHIVLSISQLENVLTWSKKSRCW